MKAEIMAVGSELLLGLTLDADSPFLASQLPALGIELRWVTQVGDDLASLGEALGWAWARSDLILVTGGLGPTGDDLTREAIASFLQEELRPDPSLEEELRRRFALRGQPMPVSNLRQARLIPSAQPLPNPLGTAPGWWVEREGRILVALPGPPRELELMWREQVASRLRRWTEGVITTRMLKTAGLGEAAVAELAEPLLAGSGLDYGYYAKPDGIHIRLTARAREAAEARALIAPHEERLREALKQWLWGADGDTLEGLTGQMLREKGLTLATMESCTGGLLASTITDVPGSSFYFKGGFVAYTAGMKQALGIPEESILRHGVVSPQVAEAMARAARGRLGADVGIGITGVAGPEPAEGKPVGTVHLAVVSAWGREGASPVLPGSRLAIKRRAVNTALFLLRRLLLAYRA